MSTETSTDAPTPITPDVDAPATTAHDGADERRLAAGALAALAAVSVPVVGVAGWLAGWSGAVSAATGLAFVLVLFGASALLLMRAARRGQSGIAVLTIGAVVRLPLYIVVLRVLEGVDAIHGRSLAAATAIAVAVTLAYEIRLMAGMPRLFWVDPAVARPTSPTPDTRSQSL